MSFTHEIKNEISLLSFSIMEETVELAGFVRNNGVKSHKEIVLQMENLKVARRIITLFKTIFDVNVEIIKVGKTNFNKKELLNLRIVDKLDFILKKLMIIDDDNCFLKKPKDYFIDGEDNARSYLRGVFLASGSINDPKTSSYHLELNTDFREEALFIIDLLGLFDIPAKVFNRDKGYMVYVKEATKIGDFLRVINANRAVMYYEDIRIYRDHKNMTNRLNNCEQANVDKIIEAARRQLEDIDIIISKLGIDLVDDKLKEVIKYRKEYPEVSMSELSEIISYETGKDITKSGLNHRIRKIHELALRLKESDKKNKN